MKNLSDSIQATLNINKQNLAGLIGVTEQSLNEWELIESDFLLPNKAKRLALLSDIIKYVSQNYPQIKESSYLEILHNERIVFNPEDLEDGDVSFIGFINANPSQVGWKIIVSQILDEHLKLL